MLIPVKPARLHKRPYKDNWVAPPIHSASYRRIRQFADIPIWRVVPSVVPEHFQDAMCRIKRLSDMLCQIVHLRVTNSLMLQ